jgi:hypothetical protein
LGQSRRAAPRDTLREHDRTPPYGAHDGIGAEADNRGRRLILMPFAVRPQSHHRLPARRFPPR